MVLDMPLAPETDNVYASLLVPISLSPPHITIRIPSHHITSLGMAFIPSFIVFVYPSDILSWWLGLAINQNLVLPCCAIPQRQPKAAAAAAAAREIKATLQPAVYALLFMYHCGGCQCKKQNVNIYVAPIHVTSRHIASFFLTFQYRWWLWP